MEADVTVESPPTQDGTAKRTWHAVLAVEGVRTSDGREFAPGSLRWRALPLPLMWQMQSDEHHKGSVVVGRIDRIERQGNEIHGWGVFDLGSENGREAHRLVSEQIMRGVSIDAELLEIDREQLMGGEDGEIVLYVEEARIGATTIVSFPAFPQAVIALADAEIPPATEDGRAESVVSPPEEEDAFIHVESLESFAVSDAPWNGATSRFTDAEYRRSSAACRGSDAPVKSACFLPHHEPNGAVSRAGVHAAAGRFNQTQAPPASKTRARSHLASHYRRDLKEDVPKILMQAALLAHADTPGPPAIWFDNPELKGPTPLTVARNGRVYGHGALWDACHTGYKECMKPFHSRTNYAYFLTGAVFVADCDCDGAIPTGPIVMNTGHADQYAPESAARSHYDHTGFAVADVSVGEDTYGIWVAGSLRPGATEAQIRALRGSSLSGDWRYIGGNMELIGFLAVNIPGFPIPRVAAGFDSGVQVSLTAAGISEDNMSDPDASPATTDPAELLEELKRERQVSENSGEDETESEDESTTEDTDGTTDETTDTSDSDTQPDPSPPVSSGLSASDLILQLKSPA